MTTKYTWWMIEENISGPAGEAARRHGAESGHRQFLATYGPTITCAHPSCEPQWQHSEQKDISPIG